MQPVWMLSATQALCMSGSFLFVLLGGIIGAELAPVPALATLPVSVLILGLATSVLPAGALIRRHGRRAVAAHAGHVGGPLLQRGNQSAGLIQLVEHVGARGRVRARRAVRASFLELGIEVGKVGYCCAQVRLVAHGSISSLHGLLMT